MAKTCTVETEVACEADQRTPDLYKEMYLHLSLFVEAASLFLAEEGCGEGQCDYCDFRSTVAALLGIGSHFTEILDTPLEPGAADKVYAKVVKLRRRFSAE